jgi:hypothetical protein
MRQSAIYSLASTREVAGFLDGVINTIENGGGGEAVLDSVKNESGVTAPKHLDTLLGEANEDAYKKIFDSVAEGVKVYKHEHGVYPTADVAEAALQQGLACFRGIDARGNILDSATSAHHDQMSLQPNRAVVAILSLFSEAIPWAGYLPVDIGSNEGRLAILSHLAGSTGGDYTNGGLLDGTNAGGVFASSQRMVKFNTATGTTYTSAFTTANLSSTPGYCDPAGTGVPVLRGRTIVYINGLVAAVDAANGSGATSAIAGTITMPTGVQITLTGTVTLATGAISITSSINLASYDVTAQSIIDFELQPALIQKVGVNATVYTLFANSWRVMTGVTIDGSTQMRNELGLDAASEGLLAIRAQMAQERHYQALRMAYSIGKNNPVAYDFGYSTQIAQKTRAQIWQDFAAVIGNADQNMANLTMDHGITHLYVPGFIAAQCQSLPPELFTSSGIETRPSIYRVGKLFNKYDVYYDPKVASQAANLQSAEIVAVGRSTQVARNPVVLGDAVSPTLMQLALNSDLVQNAAVYGRDFTVTNPHQPSALGAARISVSNLA